MVDNNRYQQVVPFILFVLVLILLFQLVRPIITVILTSVLLAYISFPLYQKISKKVSNKSLSITLSLLVIVFVILIPFCFLAFEVMQQSYYFYNSLSNSIDKGALFGFGCASADSKVCLLVNQLETFSLERLSTFGFDKQVIKLIPIFEEKITRFILSAPIIIARLFITVVIAFFILKDWKKILVKTVGMLPMRKKTVKKLIKQFGDIAYTVIYAQLFVAAVQGVVSTLGFYLFGLPFPIVLGVLVALFSLIPTIGTAIIWVPASLYLMLSGYFTNDLLTLWQGIGLFFYGLLIISTIDNILLAKIVHRKTSVNQILIIVGVIGGAVMFGVFGVFIGPILLPLIITYLEAFKHRFR